MVVVVFDESLLVVGGFQEAGIHLHVEIVVSRSDCEGKTPRTTPMMPLPRESAPI